VHRDGDVADGSTPAQACQVILNCLNSVDCLKTYCSATTVRQGWTPRIRQVRPD
jgi:hypothetical protein